MLDKNDIKVLRGMFADFRVDFKLEMRDEMNAIVKASENRLEKKIEHEVGQVKTELHHLREELTDFLDEQVLQPIAELRAAVFPAR